MLIQLMWLQVTVGATVAIVRPSEEPAEGADADALQAEIAAVVDEQRLPYILLRITHVKTAAAGDMDMLSYACPGISEGDTYFVGVQHEPLTLVSSCKPLFQREPTASLPMSVRPSQVVAAPVQLTEERRGLRLSADVAAACKIGALQTV